MNYIYLIGQLCDFFGAAIVFTFGSIPGVNNLPGSWRMKGNPHPKAFWRAKWYPIISLIGFALIAIGFLLQIIPTINTISNTR